MSARAGHEPVIRPAGGRYIADCPSCAWYAKAGPYPLVRAAADQHRNETRQEGT